MTTNRMGLEQALSDERIEQYANDNRMCNVNDEIREMARELLAYRKAVPVADVVAWNKPGEERKCDIRWRRFDVAPGPLFEAPPLQAVTDGWVKCSERMPTIGDRDIWIWNGEYAHSGYVWDGNAFVDWNEEYEELKGVTHWMPMELPAAPQR